jgi:hypothetical protein
VRIGKVGGLMTELTRQAQDAEDPPEQIEGDECVELGALLDIARNGRGAMSEANRGHN